MTEFEKLVDYINKRIDWKFYNYINDRLTSYQDNGWDIYSCIFLKTEIMDSKYTTLYTTQGDFTCKNFMVLETPFWHDTIYSCRNNDIVYGIFYNVNHKGYRVSLMSDIYRKIENKCELVDMNRIYIYAMPKA